MAPPPLTILVIDENRIRAAIIEAGLRDAGHEAEIAQFGRTVQDLRAQ